MIKLIRIILLALIIQGCANTKNPDSVLVPADKLVQIDSALLVPCDYLEAVQITSFDGALQAYATLSTKYGTCAIKQLSSIKLIKKLGNNQ